MAMSQQIAQTKSHHQAHQQGTEIIVVTQDDVIDPHLEITIELGTITVTIRTDICLAGRDPIPAVIATRVPVELPYEVILGPIIEPHTAAHHTTEAQVHTATDETLHTEDPHHIEVFPGIRADPDHMHHTNTTTKHHQNYLTALTKQPGETKTGNTNKSPLMNHHPNTIALMNKPVNQMMI